LHCVWASHLIAKRTVECVGSVVAHYELQRRNAARMKGGELC
jgi:hypothetical protein